APSVHSFPTRRSSDLKNIEKPRNEEFCLRFQVDSRHVRLLARPDGNSDQWNRDASHWQVEIYRPGKGQGKSIVTTYSMGSLRFRSGEHTTELQSRENL